MEMPAYVHNEENAASHLCKCTCGAAIKRQSGQVSKCEACGFCARCAGTGRFITMVVNGIPTGPGGDCFRCNGKGFQTPADVRRCDYYDHHRQY